jgi:hypothetical protein
VAGFLYFRLQEGCLADGTGGVTAVVYGTLPCGCGLWYPAMICVSFATGPRVVVRYPTPIYRRWWFEEQRCVCWYTRSFASGCRFVFLLVLLADSHASSFMFRLCIPMFCSWVHILFCCCPLQIAAPPPLLFPPTPFFLPLNMLFACSCVGC